MISYFGISLKVWLILETGLFRVLFRQVYSDFFLALLELVDFIKFPEFPACRFLVGFADAGDRFCMFPIL
jgi:hypothetical protein